MRDRIAGCRPRIVVFVVLVVFASCRGGTPPTEAPTQIEGFEVSLLGYVSKTYETDFDTALASTKHALTTLGFHVSEETGALFEKTFEIESQDGTSVVVVVAAVTKSSTKVSIKVGYLLGNKDAAQRIHSEIEAEIAGLRGDLQGKQRGWGRSITGNPVAKPSPSPEKPPDVRATSTRSR